MRRRIISYTYKNTWHFDEFHLFIYFASLQVMLYGILAIKIISLSSTFASRNWWTQIHVHPSAYWVLPFYVPSSVPCVVATFAYLSSHSRFVLRVAKFTSPCEQDEGGSQLELSPSLYFLFVTWESDFLPFRWKSLEDCHVDSCVVLWILLVRRQLSNMIS